MPKMRNVVVILIVIVIALLIQGSIFSAIVNTFSPPPKADSTDTVIEDIGGDNFLTAKLNYCLKLDEKNISDASFETSSGNWSWYDAKNITYVNTFGDTDYMIVWKTSADKYDFENNGVNLYLSDYLTDRDARCFIEYSYENDCVYGIILGTGNISHSESNLMYTVLGLNQNGFKLSNTDSGYSVNGNYYSSGSSYHTVIPDRYTLSRTDPGAYYDHYEYGDDYGIDDYLEVEGYD